MTTIPAPLSQPSLLGALRRAIGQPQFLAAFSVLFIAGLSLSAATSYMRLYFKKEPVPLAKPLETIPPKLGAWVQVSKDKELDPEMLDVLGTKQYIFREYVNSKLVDPRTIERFKDQTDTERAEAMASLVASNPNAAVRISVTYYTGMVDTVAHIPDRCYVADGKEPTSKVTPVWSLGGPEQSRQIQVSLIRFEDVAPGRKTGYQNVAYVFHCNGSFEYDAITGVRRRLQNLTVRQSYYAKIEIMTQMEDLDKSQEVMRDFLSSALPDIERCLPDWQKVTATANSVANSAANGGK